MAAVTSFRYFLLVIYPLSALLGLASATPYLIINSTLSNERFGDPSTPAIAYSDVFTVTVSGTNLGALPVKCAGAKFANSDVDEQALQLRCTDPQVESTLYWAPSTFLQGFIVTVFLKFVLRSLSMFQTIPRHKSCQQYETDALE